MKILMARISIVLFSLVFTGIVLATVTADRLSAISYRPHIVPFELTLQERLELARHAAAIDPLDGELSFRIFKLLQEIRVREGIERPSREELHMIREALEKRPLWPKYHLYYGLVLDRMSPAPNFITKQLILTKLENAVYLKPYSSLYRNKYKEYLEKYGESDPGENL